MGSSTENSAFQVTRNPWDLARVPGGSSGGSAAAVAADSCAVALGSDTGGSIRQPAALTGTVGLKPTYGRVSRFGLIAFGSSLDQIGPIAKDVRDAALLLRETAGHDPADGTTAMQPVPDYLAALGRGVSGMRLGIPRQYFPPDLNAEVAAAVKGAIERLVSAGAKTVEVDLPSAPYSIATYYIVATSEASSNLARYDGVKYGHRDAGAKDLFSMYALSRRDGFGPEVKRRIMLGTYALSAGYYDAFYKKGLQVRTLLRREFDRAFSACDAILSPTSPFPAFRIGEKVDDPISMYLSDIFTVAVNLAGIPGVSVPCGRTRDGLPIGLQVLAPPFAEEAMLRVAHEHEKLAGATPRAPL
jgi:aspartyl-tRNA(Asn)/glutamyl-tRNA(Gln) amidotransferase subunit A